KKKVQKYFNLKIKFLYSDVRINTSMKYIYQLFFSDKFFKIQLNFGTEIILVLFSINLIKNMIVNMTDSILESDFNVQKNCHNSHTINFFNKKIVFILTEIYCFFLKKYIFTENIQYTFQWILNKQDFACFNYTSNCIQVRYDITINNGKESFFIFFPISSIKKIHTVNVVNFDNIQKNATKNKLSVSKIYNIDIVLNGYLKHFHCISSNVRKWQVGDIIPIISPKEMYLTANGQLIASGKYCKNQTFHACCLQKFY
ncbi:hypothetical protein, partial [Buchnera aphidicola]